MTQRNDSDLATVLPFAPRRSQEMHADSNPLPPRPAIPQEGPRHPEPPRLVLLPLAA